MKSATVRLDIPYYSQYYDVLEPSWQSRACGMACTKMVLDFVKPRSRETIDDLIEEGVLVGGYTPEHGWDHEAIVRIFRNRGVSAYREEFRTVLVDALRHRFLKSTHESPMVLAGIEKIGRAIRLGRPAIVSVESGFDDNKTPHMIVITGFHEGEGFFYNDSNAKIGVKKDHFVDLERFKKYWRKLAIFID